MNTSRAAYVCDAASTFYVQREVGAKAAGFQKAAALGSEVRQVEVGPDCRLMGLQVMVISYKL